MVKNLSTTDATIKFRTMTDPSSESAVEMESATQMSSPSQSSSSPTETFDSLARRCIVIAGATAAGKSDVAMKLAETIGGEIVSLDSIAVYRGMDIGTAKPSPSDRASVPHHLIDVVDPTEQFSVACYLRHAHAAVADIVARSRTPIFVGGTPMFLKGVLRGFDPGPPADWEFRKSVEADLQSHGIDALRERLRQVDPLAEHRIDPGDSRRMIRALEVARHYGQPISHRQIQFDRPVPANQCRVFAIRWPRPQLHARIHARVDAMFAAGLVDEVRGLLDQHQSLSRTASQAVGYREVIDHLDGRRSIDETIEAVKTHTRQMAKRQESWLRSFSEVRYVDVDETLNVDAVLAEIDSPIV